ncbi:AAWKG family protein [Streptomyces sp. NPDC021093]|uniref:AAWKG family protein n=1 Tax=Streptomyces sp. NPDC021093 TaxID=3365112 RepID=UPI0037AD41DC
MAADSKWESVVKQITGFDGGTRENVAAVGGADAAVGNGSEWMQVKVEKVIKVAVADDRNTAGDVDTAGKHERVIQFYGPPSGQAGTTLVVYKATISLPWSSSTGADWSDAGNAGVYDWGYGKALETLRDTYTSQGFGSGYPHHKAVTEADAINLKNFSPMAEAFNRVVDYFSAKSIDLEQWVKQLDGEFSAYQGNGADVFRDLVDAVSLGYKDFLTLIAPESGVVAPGGGRAFKSNSTFKSRSAVGDRLIDGELAIWTAVDRLATAWGGWQSGQEPAIKAVVDSKYANPAFRPANVWLGTSHLDALLNELADWLNKNNISKMWQHFGNNKTGEGFLYQHPVYGNLTVEGDWKNISTLACSNWLATLGPLDVTSEKVMTDLNEALYNLNSGGSAFPFKAGVNSLKEANAVDEAGKAKAEAEKEKADAKKELDQQKEEMKKEKEDAKKEMEDLKEKGGGGTGDIKPPPLDPNKIGGNEFGGGGAGGGAGGTGGLDGKKPPTGQTPPPLGLNGIGGNNGDGLNGGGAGNTTKLPDGSLSTKNPDGSTTITHPDGRKEIVPPGILPPPPLNPNGVGGGWGGGAGTGTGGTPVKTVKGPDGSTTAYNSDGSRTTTHKDGTTTTVSPDGTSVTNNPDGSKTVLNKDGSETITYQDGTKTTVKPDGSTVTQYPDGSSTKLAPNGTLTTTDAQGNSTTSHPQPGSTVKNPDGSSTVYGKDGATTTTHEDGTKTTVAANGTVTTVDPDGTKTVSHLGKGTSTITYADGSVAQVGPDGTVSTTYKDGSTTKLGPDGTYTTTDADGHKKTEHLNTTGGPGTPQTTHNPDGSTTTKYPDGTVDKQLKNGGHQITYPDGRTVTTDVYGRTTGGTGGAGGGGGLGPNKIGGGSGGFDYYDYPDGKNGKSPLGGGGYGGGGGDTGSQNPRIPLNPLGGQGLTPGGPGGAGGAPGAGLAGERARAVAAGEANAARQGRAAQLAAEEAALARRPSTSSNGGMPMMPPMGGGMGGGGANTQSDERERSTWVSEDEETWGTDEGGVSAVIGR